MDRASDLDIYDRLQKVGFQEKTRKTDGRGGSQSVLLVNWSVTICPDSPNPMVSIENSTKCPFGVLQFVQIGVSFCPIVAKCLIGNLGWHNLSDGSLVFRANQDFVS